MAGGFPGRRTRRSPERCPRPLLETLEPRLLLSVGPPTAARIVDDGEASFATTGTWDQHTGAGHLGDYLSLGDGSIEDSATWTFEGLSPGYAYRVSGTWVPGTDRSTQASYEIIDYVDADLQTTLRTSVVDQTGSPDDFNDAGAMWEDLGEPCLVRAETLVIRLVGCPGETVLADAIRIERTGQYVAPIGIPAPEFGVDQSHWMYAAPEYTYDFGSGPEPYRTGEDGPYTHYVNTAAPNATDAGNPFGTLELPRKTVPATLSAGSVVEVHGGGYTSKWQVTSNGTESAPVFIRGALDDTPVVLTDIVIGGQYVICENILQSGQHNFIAGPYGVGAPHHVAVRNCELSGDAQLDRGTGLIAFGNPGEDTHHVVFYNNHIHHQGDCKTETSQDRHGMAVTRHTSNIWVLDNIAHHNQADAIQVNGWENETTHHIYIGRNIFSSDGENAIDIKEASHVIVSQNIMFEYEHSQTAAVNAHSDDLQIYGPENVWVLFNYIYDVYDGIISKGIKGNFYAIGNVVNGATDAGIKSWSHGIRHVIGNTVYKSERALAHSGESNLCHIINNIISSVEETGYHIYYEGTTAVEAQMHHNLVYEHEDPLRILWGGEVFVDIPTFQTGTGKGEGCIDADPLFVDAARGDFHLTDAPGNQSPAIDAAAGIEYYVGLYYSLYGQDIGVGFDGTPRWPDPPPDIGAFEIASDPSRVDNNPPAAADLSSTADEDTAIIDTAVASDADGDELLFFVFQGPEHGSVEMSPGGTFVYTPQPDWYGEDSFIFRAYDGWDFSQPATVGITITAVQDPPRVRDDVAITDGESSVLLSVLDNDTDVDGDTLSVSGFTDSAYGDILDHGDGVFTYTPGAGFTDRDSFTYTATDGHGNYATATVHVTYLPAGWSSQDIGDVEAVGSASYSPATEVYTAIGSGGGAAGPDDECHYAYHLLTGDGGIYARVVHMDNTDPWAQGGLMFRASLSPASPNVFVAITPENGIVFQYRGGTGDDTVRSAQVDGLGTSHWVALVRSGNTFCGYQSQDGERWKLVGSVTIEMPLDVYVGMAVSSLDDGVLCAADFDGVTVGEDVVPPVITGVKLNARAGSSVSSVEPCSGGVQTIEVNFNEPVSFEQDDVGLWAVSFHGDSETTDGVLVPQSIAGSGTDTMVISLQGGTVVNTWVKVALGGSSITDIAGNLLDGNAPAGGSGFTCLYDASVDLPSGDGSAGGNAAFYLASLKGDVTGDLFVGQSDLDVVLSFWGQYVLPGDPSSGDLTDDGFVGAADLDVILDNWGWALPISPPIPGDLNCDGFVGQGDLAIVLDKWGQSVSLFDPADPNGDLLVGQDDLSIVLDNWGQSASSALREDAVSISTEANSTGSRATGGTRKGRIALSSGKNRRSRLTALLEELALLERVDLDPLTARPARRL